MRDRETVFKQVEKNRAKKAQRDAALIPQKAEYNDKLREVRDFEKWFAANEHLFSDADITMHSQEYARKVRHLDQLAEQIPNISREERLFGFTIEGRRAA